MEVHVGIQITVNGIGCMSAGGGAPGQVKEKVQSAARMLLVLFAVGALAACGSRMVREAPVVINENAHSGGSVVAFSTAGELLASGGWEGRVRLWQVPAGSQVRTWGAHSDSVNGIVFTDSDRQLVTAGYDGRIARWSTGGKLLDEIETSSPVMHMTARVSADWLLTGHADGSVREWRLSDLSLLKAQVLHRGSVKAVAIDPAGDRFASSGSDGAVYVWSTGMPARRLEDPPADAWTLAFSPDGKVLMGGSWFRLYRWQLRDASLQTLATRHRGIIRSIRYLPASRTLASISRQTDSAVYFLDPATGAVVRSFQQHDLCGADVTVSPDGRYLATTSDDASVRIWDLGTVRPTGGR